MSRPLGRIVARLVRSGMAGLVATAVDVALLAALVELAGTSARFANVPALVVSGVVMFFGQKYFAFQGSGAPRTRELLEFALVQAGGLLVTGFLYDLALRLVPLLSDHYVVARLVTTNIVWLGYSFPLWHLVFRRRSAKVEPP